MRTLLILVALIALSGCDTTPTKTATSNRSKKGISNGGIARYAFHRNAGISDVKKTLPDGSIDYVDFDMADNPSVLVVVTASAPPSDGLTFTTAFSERAHVSLAWCRSRVYRRHHLSLSLGHTGLRLAADLL